MVKLMVGGVAMMALMMASTCSGGGTGTASIDTLEEGTGPAFDVTQTDSTADLVKSIVEGTQYALFEILPDTDAENEAIKNQLCTTKHVNETISGGHEGLSITGVLKEDWVGNDGLSLFLELNGLFENFTGPYEGESLTLTGDSSYTLSGSASSGAQAYCSGKQIISAASYTASSSGAFSLSGGIGGKIVYEYTTTYSPGSNIPTTSGSATFVSGGETSTCAISLAETAEWMVVTCE